MPVIDPLFCKGGRDVLTSTLAAPPVTAPTVAANPILFPRLLIPLPSASADYLFISNLLAIDTSDFLGFVACKIESKIEYKS